MVLSEHFDMEFENFIKQSRHFLTVSLLQNQKPNFLHQKGKIEKYFFSFFLQKSLIHERFINIDSDILFFFSALYLHRSNNKMTSMASLVSVASMASMASLASKAQSFYEKNATKNQEKMCKKRGDPFKIFLNILEIFGKSAYIYCENNISRLLS